jgi:acetyl esterase/lipase
MPWPKSDGRAHAGVMTRYLRKGAAAASLVSVAIAGACVSGADTPVASRSDQVITQDYLPGLAADVYLPAGVSSAPVVVLVPGGAWLTADRTGLAPLAQALAAAGIVAVNTTHRAVRSGGRFPEPVADVLCSVDFAVQRAAVAGLAASTVVVLGHSSGAHLASLAALGGDHFRASCPYPRVAINALAGLAGTYDVSLLEDLAQPLFGTTPAQSPTTWRDGNPMSWVQNGTRRSTLTVFLAHGTSDNDLPTSFTTGFADALKSGGYDVTIAMIPGATHHTLYSASVIGPRLVDWVRAVTSAASHTVPTR